MALKDEERLIPMAKAGLSALSSMVAEPVSGWAGILSGGSQEAIERARAATTYIPEDVKAKSYLRDLSYAMEPIGIAASDLSRKMGDKVYETTGSEMLAAGATALPEAILSVGGLKSLKLQPSTLNPDITPSKAQVEKAVVKTLDPFNLHKGQNPLEAKMYVGKEAKGIPKWDKDNILLPGEQGVGWRLAPDGKMRFQTSDIDAKFKLEPQHALTVRHGSPMKNILDHPKLFKMYPELGDIKVHKTSNPRENGHFAARWDKEGNFKGSTIAVRTTGRTENEVMGTLLHEIQHWVQTREGFSPGSSPAKFENLKTKVLPEKARDYKDQLAALTYMQQMKAEGLSATDIFNANKHKVSLATAKHLKQFDKDPEYIEALLENTINLQKNVQTLQALKKTSSGWQYSRTLGEMEARDVTDMWNRERLGADPEQMVPSISRKKTAVGGAYEDVIIDPQTEALVLPPQTADPMRLKDIRNVN